MQRSTRRTAGVAITILGILLSLVGLLAAPASADPPGSNGTVKIDGTQADDGPGHSGNPNDPDSPNPDNDPHVECPFEVEFFNFDTGQTADITFTARPPTGHMGLLFTENAVISTDGTTGAPNDADEVFTYDLSGWDLSAFEGEFHNIHGLHVKLDITVYAANGDEIPGAQKHKVFWLEGCLPDEPEECPEGTTWVDENENQVVDEGECETTEVEECPEGTTWVDENENQVVDEGECETTEVEECPEGTTWVDENENQVVDEGECENPPPTPDPADLSASIECAAGGLLVTVENDGDLAGAVDVLSDDGVVIDNVSVPGNGSVTQLVLVEEDTAYDIEVTDVETFTGTRDCTEVLPEVIVPETPETPEEPAAAPEVVTPTPKPSGVLGVQLPRTGSDSVPLSAAGIGLLVLGAGLVLAGRRWDPATA